MGRFKSLRFDFYVFNFDTMKVILFGKSAEKPYGKLLLTKRNGTQVSYQYLRSDLNWLDNNDTVSYRKNSKITDRPFRYFSYQDDRSY